MPELPEVEAVRRALLPALHGARFDDVIVRRENLRRPFPPAFAERLRGHAVEELRRRGKYLLADLSSGETLLVHLGMSGEFRVEAVVDAVDLELPAAPASPSAAHDHVVFQMSSGYRVTFNDPRRFGVMDLVRSAAVDETPPIRVIGLEPLSPEFDGAAVARACAGKRTPIKVALLDQRVVAGLGNIYASEALHVARLLPRRRAGAVATARGLPKPAADRLAAAIKSVIGRALERTSQSGSASARFRVYGRESQSCRRRRCPGRIKRIQQAGRSTFFCPVCQRG